MRQGRIEDGTREFSIAQQGFGGQLPPQIVMELQRAQALGQPLAAMESQIRTTVRPPPGVLSSQHTSAAGPMTTSIIQTIIQEPIQPQLSPIMPPPANFSMAMASQIGQAGGFPPPRMQPGSTVITEIAQPGPPGFPPQSGFGRPSNVFQSRAPLM